MNVPPLVAQRYAIYLRNHRIQADGHFFQWWKQQQKASDEGMEEALCALIYNAIEYLDDILQRKPHEETAPADATLLAYRSPREYS